MPSAERVAGQMRRAMNVHRFALGEKRQQENDLGALQRHKAAFKAEEIRVIAARKELYGESPHVPRFSATNLPHPVPTKLKLGWAADAEVHGWFGGCESQLEYIEAQAQKISSLQKQLETSRRATHGAIAATLRVKALNKANAAAAVTTARRQAAAAAAGGGGGTDADELVTSVIRLPCSVRRSVCLTPSSKRLAN